MLPLSTGDDYGSSVAHGDLLSFPLSILSGKITFILNRGTDLVKPGLSGESQNSCVFKYL